MVAEAEVVTEKTAVEPVDASETTMFSVVPEEIVRAVAVAATVTDVTAAPDVKPDARVIPVEGKTVQPSEVLPYAPIPHLAFWLIIMERHYNHKRVRAS